MSKEKTPLFLTALSVLFPIILLLVIDIYTMFLQPQAKAVSHLAFGVLVAQLLCSLVFLKGDICNGQRTRLSQMHAYLALYWGVWFLLSLFSNYHYIPTDMICLCGLLMVLAAWKQPQDAQLRRALLMMGVIAGVIGLFCYLFVLIEIPMSGWVQYDLIAQTLSGIVLANLLLLLSRNRLQGFIALLPLIMAVVLFLNALIVLVILAVMYFSSAVAFANDLAIGLYFLLHLLVALILAIPIFRKEKADYPMLMILLITSASLPLWASFAHIQ